MTGEEQQEEQAPSSAPHIISEESLQPLAERRVRRQDTAGRCPSDATQEAMSASLNSLVARHGFPDTDGNISVVWSEVSLS